MNSDFIKNIVEAALMVADKPLSLEQLLALFDPAEQEELSESVAAALLQLQEECNGRGFELRKVSSGYRFQARAEFAPWVNRLWEERPARYSRAFMETLAIIAYKQPITRGEIEEIRGVAVSSTIIKTMLEREWLRVAGHRDVPGRPAVYVTTPQFLDYFNLGSLADLPALTEPSEFATPDNAFADPIEPGADPLNDAGAMAEPLVAVAEAAVGEAVAADGSTEQVTAEVQDTEAQDTEAQDIEAQDTEAQDTEAQDTEAQDTEAQDIEAQDTEAQDTEAQDTEAQDTEAQDTEAQDTEAQDTEAQDTEAQDTEAQDTEAQDTEAQDTEAQDTEAQDTEAQDTEAQDVEAQDIEAQDTEDRVTPQDITLGEPSPAESELPSSDEDPAPGQMPLAAVAPLRDVDTAAEDHDPAELLSAAEAASHSGERNEALTEVSLADLEALSDAEIADQVTLTQAAVDQFDADAEDDLSVSAAQSNG